MALAREEGSTLKGDRVAITGRLASMTRAAAIERIAQTGGEYVREVDTQTTVLIVGQEGWPLRSDGRVTRSLERARALIEEGVAIEILAEGEFLVRLGVESQQDQVTRLYTIEQLARILEMPISRLRTWMRAGLIKPVRTIRRLCYFDFEQVVGAKLVNDLVGAGVTPGRLRASLVTLRKWLPGTERPLAQLGVVERGGELFVRLENGRLAEPNGQLLLFDQPDEARETENNDDDELPKRPLRIKKDWYLDAVNREDSGDLEAAAEAYHQALLEGEIEPEICFNMGNVLYELGQKEAACQRFMQAVEVDPAYVEAWNNLGNVLSEMGRHEKAVRAYRAALELEPRYADAHYNLAETLFQIGHLKEAREHWRAYLKQDPSSTWSRHVEERLREVDELDCED